MFDLWVAGNRPRIADECCDFVALHSRGYIGNRYWAKRLRNRERVSELVDFKYVGNVTASADQPDHAAGENQREQKQPAGRYLPVAFAENVISVTLIPLSTRLDVEVCTHRLHAPHNQRCDASIDSPKSVRLLSEFWFGTGEKRTNDESGKAPI